MYLISLTNYDYAWVTAFFSAFCLIAYYYRRRNSTALEFLTSNTKFDILALSGFGLIEIIIAGIGGSYYGFNAIYAVVIVLFLVLLGQKRLLYCYSAVKAKTFPDYIRKKYGRVSGLAVSVMLSLLLIFCISLAMCLVFKSIHALMGWNFGNSVFGLFGVSLIALVVGGRSGVTANKLLNYAMILLAFLLVIVIGLYQIGGVNSLIANLSRLAVAQKFSSSYYIKAPFNLSNLILFGGLVVGLGGFYLLTFSSGTKSGLTQPTKVTLMIRVAVAIILILPGIIAIATPIGGGIEGKQIVTIEAQLPDGQMGYIVKAVDKQSKEVDTTPGLIPPLLNPNTNLVENGQYDYMVSNIVTFRHYLPQPLMIIILLMLLAGFLATIADYLLDLSRVVVKNIVLPFNLVAKYGDIGELWAIRLCILAFGAITLTIAHFAVLNFNLLLYILLLGSLLVAPLTAVLILSLAKVKLYYIPWYLIIGVISSAIYLYVINSSDILDKFILGGLVGFILTVLSAIVLGQLKK